MTTPADIAAAGMVLDDVKEESDHLGFEEAVALREALLVLKKQTADTISFVESEMLRQCERAPKVVNIDGRMLTFINGPDRSVKTDHHQVMTVLYRHALRLATDDNDGHVDWGALGSILEGLVIDTYLSPSTTAKAGGLSALGLGRKDVETATVTRRKLVVHEESDE